MVKRDPVVRTKSGGDDEKRLNDAALIRLHHGCLRQCALDSEQGSQNGPGQHQAHPARASRREQAGRAREQGARESRARAREQRCAREQARAEQAADTPRSMFGDLGLASFGPITQTNCFAPQPPNAAAVLSERPVSVRQRLSDGRRECVVCRRSQSCLSRGGGETERRVIEPWHQPGSCLALASAGRVVDLALASALAGGHAGHAHKRQRGAAPT